MKRLHAGILLATRRTTALLSSLVCLTWAGTALPASSRGGPEILPLERSDEARSEEQRAIAEALTRRWIGTAPVGGPEDLELLQTLIDREVLEADQTFELQALGVVLGDVMAAELPLQWVLVRDENGRSRALRYKQTSTLFFPVTMISRRIEGGAPVVVRELYDRVARRVHELENPPRRGGAIGPP